MLILTGVLLSPVGRFPGGTQNPCEDALPSTLLHPSRETAESIIATEPRLVAAQVCYTPAWFWSWLACPGSIRLTAASWDDWDWQVCWLASWAPI